MAVIFCATSCAPMSKDLNCPCHLHILSLKYLWLFIPLPLYIVSFVQHGSPSYLEFRFLSTELCIMCNQFDQNETLFFHVMANF